MDISLGKEAHVRLNNIQLLELNRAPSITSVPPYHHRFNVNIAHNKKVQQAKFYHKSAFSPSISSLVKEINNGHFATWPNLTANLIQNISTKITATSKGHLDQV